MVETLKPLAKRSTSTGTVQKVEQNEVAKAPEQKAGGPLLPKVNAEFEPNEAFFAFDASMARAVASMRASIASPPLNGKITDDQLKELAQTGKLSGNTLTGQAGDLVNIAKLLSTPEGSAFKAQLGNPITPAALDAAWKTGFATAHEAILVPRLTAYAAALDGPLKFAVDAKNKAIDVGKLHAMLSTGKIGGQTLTELIPDEAKRKAFIDGASMLTDNRRLFAAVGTMSASQLADLCMGKPVNLDDGVHKWSPKLSDVVSTTMPIRPAPEPMVEINDPRWAAKLPLFVSEYAAYIEDRSMVAFHEAWHSKNGSGGVNGPESGEWFTQFHADMGGDFVEFLKLRGTDKAALLDGQMPLWDTTKSLPIIMVKGKPLFPTPNNINYKTPSFLARQGQPSAAAPPFKLTARDGSVQSIRCLDDIKTADDLGRVMGESGVHAVAHVTDGGVMATFKSVQDRRFPPWHYGAIEKIRYEWLKTDNGKRFLAENPMGWRNPYLDPHDVVMHDVVAQVAAKSREMSSFTPAGAATATRGGPALRSMAAAGQRTRGQVAQDERDARAQAEALCSVARNPDKAIFSADQILEAAAGFQDTGLKQDGEERTKRRRATRAREPWSKS